MVRYIFTLFLSLGFLCSHAQEDKLRDLYQSRDFEKCYKKADAIVMKDFKVVYAQYYKALALFEMEQLPSKYKEITEQPLEDCLKALGKVTKYDEDGEYASQHQDTLKIIREYAEQIADDLITSYKARSVRLYKLLLKAFPLEYSPIKIIDIYFMADDFDNGFRAVERLYANAPADVSRATKGERYWESIEKAPLLLVKYSMFNNAYYIIDSYKQKFENNPEVSQFLLNIVYASLEKLAPASDKNLFFSYTDRSLQLYGDNPEFKKYLYNLYVSVLDEKLKAYEAIDNPSSWKDSVPLRDYFMYAEICHSIFPVAEIKEKEQAVIDTYRLMPDIMPGKVFQRTGNAVLNEMRYNQCVCNTGVFPGQDSLEYSLDLALMAQGHAKDMFAFNYTDTLDRKKRPTIERVKETGLKPFKYNTFEGVVFYGAVKATESAVYTTPISNATTEAEYRQVLETVFARWRGNKQGDCEKIMTPEYTHYGFAAFGDRYSLVLAKVLDLKD